jgi:hypothetical protein
MKEQIARTLFCLEKFFYCLLERMKSPCYLKGYFPRGWCPPGLYIQVGVVRAVVLVVSHEDFNFEFAVEASKILGLGINLRLKPSKDLRFFGGLSTVERSWKAMFDGLLKYAQGCIVAK